MAGSHEPASRGSFYLSLASVVATGTLRILMIAAAIVIGAFVLAKAFPTGGSTVDVPAVNGDGGNGGGNGGGGGGDGGNGGGGGNGGTEVPGGEIPVDQATVQVLNSTDASGLAEEKKAEVEALGFTEVSFGDAQGPERDVTEIHFRPDARAAAELIKRDLFPRATLHRLQSNAPLDISVILGADAV